MRWRTANHRRKALKRPVTCPRHGKALRGGGWVYAAGMTMGLFECPVPACRHFRLWHPPVAPTIPDKDLF